MARKQLGAIASGARDAVDRTPGAAPVLNARGVFTGFVWDGSTTLTDAVTNDLILTVDP